MAKKEIILLITAIIYFLLINSGKIRAENKEPDILSLKTGSNNCYSLSVHGKPAIKICLRKRNGKEIDPKEWTRTKRAFSSELDYNEIFCKMTAGWKLSGLRIQQTDDEISFQKGNILITLRDLQTYATLHRSDKKFFCILTNINCTFRIRIFEEGKPRIEKTFFLEYIQSEDSLTLFEDDGKFHGFDEDAILYDSELTRTPD